MDNERGVMMGGETALLLLDWAFSFAMVAAVGWLFDRRQAFGVVAVVVGSIALAALALVVGGLALHSMRAFLYVILGLVLCFLVVLAKAVCARLAKK